MFYKQLKIICEFFCYRALKFRKNIYNSEIYLGKSLINWRIIQYIIVRYHCGGWPEEVNSRVLNSYMVYL
jgi:hypothetical protein